MISEEEARARILDGLEAKPPVELPLFHTLGRFSAADLFAQIALPRFDNSAMDGYAIVAKSAGRGSRLRVRVEVSSQIRVRPSPSLISDIEQIVGAGSVELR